VVEVAVMVTELPAGTAMGDVKVVAMPLAVCVGEKVPHAPVVPQVTVQSTPALPGSLLTVAIKGAVVACTIEPVGTPSVILINTGEMIETFAVALTRGPTAVEVATITIVSLGTETVEGAVKVAANPFEVCEGTMEPQGATSQPTDQVTPEFVVSLLTSAATVAVALVNIELGGN
jgi:hypothetical protein